MSLENIIKFPNEKKNTNEKKNNYNRTTNYNNLIKFPRSYKTTKITKIEYDLKLDTENTEFNYTLKIPEIKCKIENNKTKFYLITHIDIYKTHPYFRNNEKLIENINPITIEISYDKNKISKIDLDTNNNKNIDLLLRQTTNFAKEGNITDKIKYLIYKITYKKKIHKKLIEHIKKDIKKNKELKKLLKIQETLTKI